jgi:hypothetical protein
VFRHFKEPGPNFAKVSCFMRIKPNEYRLIRRGPSNPPPRNSSASGPWSWMSKDGWKRLIALESSRHRLDAIPKSAQLARKLQE